MEFRHPLNPRETVAALDKFIIGQNNAKKAVAIALRNRWRRQQVPEDLRDEIAPKNIIMIGPTGVGKTEIARRLAKLAQSPFLKIEASKFTEVGYVGRDVESMIRDLTELAVKQVKDEEAEKVRTKSLEIAEEKLLDLLLPPPAAPPPARMGIAERATLAVAVVASAALLALAAWVWLRPSASEAERTPAAAPPSAAPDGRIPRG